MVIRLEFLYTERTHVKTLKVVFLKFYELWPQEHIDLRNEIMPNFEQLLQIHRMPLLPTWSSNNMAHRKLIFSEFVLVLVLCYSIHYRDYEIYIRRLNL